MKMLLPHWSSGSDRSCRTIMFRMCEPLSPNRIGWHSSRFWNQWSKSRQIDILLLLQYRWWGEHKNCYLIGSLLWLDCIPRYIDWGPELKPKPKVNISGKYWIHIYQYVNKMIYYKKKDIFMEWEKWHFIQLKIQKNQCIYVHHVKQEKIWWMELKINKKVFMQNW